MLSVRLYSLDVKPRGDQGGYPPDEISRNIEKERVRRGALGDQVSYFTPERDQEIGGVWGGVCARPPARGKTTHLIP